MARQLDSLGFVLPALTDVEQRARELCQVVEQSQARVKEWTAAGALTRAVAAAPTRDPPKKLKQLVRGGIPQLLRPALWYQLSGGQALAARKPQGYYDSLTLEVNGGMDLKSVFVPRAQLEAFNAFPGHSLLSSIKGLSAVRRLVLAHALHSGAANYSRGVLSVAAFLLAIMGVAKEEETFWTLAALRELRLHPLHYENMRGVRVETLTLNGLATRRCPRTAALFERAGASLGELTGEWMDSLFTRSVPPETAARIFDVLLLEGAKTLQRVGVALIKVTEPGLLQSCKGLQVVQVARWRVARTYAADSLLKVAFPSIPGGIISSASIAQLRSAHQMATAGEKVDIVRRLATVASTPAVPTGGPPRLPTLTLEPRRAASGSLAAASPVGSSGDEEATALSEEEAEAHAEAERALSENGSPREQLQMAGLSLLLTKPNLVIPAAARSI